MRLLAPGSLGWFVRHELRISWRYFAGLGGGKGRSLAIGFGIVGVGALILAASIGALLRHRGLTSPDLTPIPALMVVIIDSILLFFTSLMIVQGLATAALVFNDRGDLDLLLASPARPWKILATRMLVMAFNSMIFFQILTLPLVLTSAAIMGYWGMLAIPLVITTLAVGATAVGVVLAMTLFRLIGPRRTRTVAQLLGVAVGLSIVVVTRFMPSGRSSNSLEGYQRLRETLEHSAWGPVATWIARAATGDFLPLLSVVAGAIAVFALVTVGLGQRFAMNASIAAGATEPTPKARSGKPSTTFRSGSLRGIMVRKELKLLLRDPALISQVLLQVVYLPFVMYLTLSRNMGDDSGWLARIGASICAGAMVYVSGQLAAGLGWLTISAEEAPELLSVAPVTTDQVAQAKVTAVVLPVAVLLSVLSLGLAVISPWAALVAFFGSCVCAAGIAYVELWMQRPGKRSDFRMRRRGTGSVWVSLLEFLICGLFGSTAGLLATPSLFAILPAFGLVAVLAIIASVNKDKWLNRDG